MMSDMSNPDDWAKRGEQLLELRARVHELESKIDGYQIQTNSMIASHRITQARVLELENICSQTNYGREALLLLEKPDSTATCEYCGGYLVAHEGTVTKGMHTDCYNDLKAEKLNG
jgi:hypothetical protein